MKLFVILMLLLFLSCSKPFPQGSVYDFMVFALASQNTTTTTEPTPTDPTPPTTETPITTPVTPTPVVTDKYIFVTTNPHDGNFGGISGADAFCGTEKPASIPAGTYKAMLAASGVRDAIGQIDWVFQPSTTYINEVGSTVFTTDANGIFTFGTLSATFGTGSWWTGLNADWTAGDNCVSWTDNIVDIGNYGTSSTNSLSVYQNFRFCDDLTTYLVCVQQ
ncbi:MAG: DUF1554 domain-containing protein [Leptospiraceae bacterium]|nr:DUF1554 domain-containing protein [Leptospiraceae bacterium]